ncbi:MAG: methyl-accepting chemotaxis protein [Desulfuromonadales bacterium]|nr:MAG: methyl-accepting chemotaxis protein [Desulfuromonadales bacterium]
MAASFNEIHGALFNRNGTYERLTNIIKVAAQATASAERLKGIVSEQKSLGEQGVEKAKTVQASAIASVNRMFNSSIILVVSTGLAVLILAVFFSQHLLRSVMRSVGELGRFASRFGDGDFSTRLDAGRKDEFGQLAGNFNSSSETLNEIVVELTGAINKMVGSVADLTGAVTTIDGAVGTQASLAQESATAIEQMSATVTDVARAAVTTSELTGQSQSTARSGQKVVADTVEAMTEIATAVSAAATVMTRLAESSGQIGSVVGVINDIADQTNLLALNAAIEAARAGEQGRGFAVVADEVRALALRTTEATREIGAMIGAIQSDIGTTRQAMDAGRGRVEEGVKLAEIARQSLDEIVTACDSASQMVAQIATATEEQAATAVEISSGVGKMSDMSERTKSAAVLINTATSELERLAADLGCRAAWFK